MPDSFGILFDRSRIEDWERCPRLRFWKYEYAGTGVTRYGLIHWELLLGNAVHDAIERVTIFKLDVVEAVAQAYTKFLQPVTAIIAAEPDDTRRAMQENDLRANHELLTALTHAWVAYLPTYLTDYEPIEMEREELLTMSVGEQAITLMSRCDIISKRRNDGGLLIIT